MTYTVRTTDNETILTTDNREYAINYTYEEAERREEELSICLETYGELVRVMPWDHISVIVEGVEEFEAYYLSEEYAALIGRK